MPSSLLELRPWHAVSPPVEPTGTVPSPDPAPRGLSDLRMSLAHSDARDRREAAAALRHHGAKAVEPLCAALEDRDPTVRRAAAESLAEVGDERAIQPLVGALRRCFLGRSRLRSLVLGPVCFVGILLSIWLACLALALVGGVQALEGLFYGPRCAWDWVEERRTSGRIARSYSAALLAIAERSSSPVVRAALPELQGLAMDPLQQDRETRTASRDAARQIAALTEKLKDLPIAIRVPEHEGRSLPRAARM